MRKHQGGEYLLHKDNQHFHIIFHITEEDRYKGRLLVIISDITQSYLEQQRRYEFTSKCITRTKNTALLPSSGYAEILC